ncbi:MAG: hypothetical protein F6J87_13540 [Spirulina sp. SIO3F2]|nr:hypothetical protein [Spirulina sp. SIO3F2]
MDTELPISERRGLKEIHFGTPKTGGLLLVKASIAQVSHYLHTSMHGELKSDLITKQEYPQSLKFMDILIFQYRGHDWTVLMPLPNLSSEKIADISKNLQTSCIFLDTESVSGWSGYKVCTDGSFVEELEWGTSYIDESLCKELSNMKPQDIPGFIEQRKAKGESVKGVCFYRKWDVFYIHGYSQYQFRSNLRAVEPKEILNPTQLLNQILISQDAWLPDEEYIPWSQEQGFYETHGDVFSRVDVLTRNRAFPRICNSVKLRSYQPKGIFLCETSEEDFSFD